MNEEIWRRSYPEGVPGELEVERACLPAYLQRCRERIPNGAAIRFLNGRMTWAEVGDEVDRLAAAFQELGVQPGTRVAIQLPNMPQAVIAYYAALSVGAVVVMTNPIYTAREIEHQWNDAGCEVAVTADYLYEQTHRAMRDKVPVEHWVLASIPEYLRFPLNLLAPFKLKRQDPPLVARVEESATVHRFRKLVRRTAPITARPELDFESLAVLQYTGGTTGVSKAAMLTHANLSVNVQQLDAWICGSNYGAESVLVCLPLFHVFGMTVAMNWGVYAGALLSLVPNPRDLPAIVKAIERDRPTLFPGVPALYNALNNFEGIRDADLSSVNYCVSGSAPIPPDVLHRFEELTGARILEGFGMSESSPVTHANPFQGERKVGSVGVPLSSTLAKIVDVDEGTTELGVGEEGELIVAGPQVMRGYWNREDETAKTLRDGWLFTGDLAKVDDDGFFTIVGRKKDMINCGGLKVFPDEVDDVLMSHEGVLEAATIGVPHERRGETVKSFVVLQPGITLTAEDVEAFCRENLAAYKVPREIEFLDELPRSAVMKVLRRELREREISKRNADS